MPIVESVPNTPPPAPEAPLQIAAPEYQGIAVDTRYISKQALLGYVEGSSYTVDYFSQVLNTDTGLSGQQISVSSINQQYKRIKRFELKLTTPLSTTQDGESNAMVVTGTANVYSMLKPNVGDMFLGDIGDGQAGVFQVNEVRRMSVLQDAIHEIDFQLVSYATTERLADFDSKTINTVVFVKGLMTYGHTPFLQMEEFAIIKELGGYWSEIADMYFKSFLSNEFKTLLVPDQETAVYDAFLTEAVLALFDTYDTPEVRYVRRLNCDGDPVMKVTTIWTALIKRSVMLLQRAATQIGMVHARSFDRQAMLEGIYHSGIDYVVYPLDPEGSINSRDLKVRKPVSMQIERPEAIETLPVTTPALIPKAALTEFYVFSEAFYTKATEGQSKLELLVHDYLEEKALDHAVLLEIAKSYTSWQPIDQFYFAPILLLLIKMSIRGL